MQAPPVLAPLLALAGCASAPAHDRWPDAAPEPASPTADPSPLGGGAPSAFRPLFFEVKAPGAVHPLHLLGSIHVLDQKELPWAREIDRAFDAAEVLAIEADPRSADGAALVTRLGLLPPEQRLEDRVAPEVWDRARRAAEAHGHAAEALARLRPWLAALLLSGLTFAKLGYSEELGVERHFIQRAAGEKSLLELEGMEVQLRLFDSMGRDVEEAMLDAAARPEAELRAELEQLVGAWKRGDGAALEAAFMEPARASPALRRFNERLFYERNASMADSIARLAAGARRVFVVVGAGHLVGERGIPALLAARGFSVEQRAPIPPQVKK